MRSSHRKSRFGCRECKQRHTKCDETHPSCKNCTTSKRTCSFTYVSRPSLMPVQPWMGGVRLDRQSKSVELRAPIQKVRVGLPQHRETSLQDEQYSIVHLQLFRHAEYELGSAIRHFIPNGEDVIKLSVKEALSAAYLMDALIAAAAAHKSTLPGEDQAFYRSEATRLFTRSITKFNTKQEINEECATAAFLFSSFIGQLVLFDIFSEARPLTNLLDRLAHCIKLHQGIRGVIGSMWHKIQQTQPAMSCQVAEWVSDGRLKQADPERECSPLWEMLSRSDVDVNPQPTYVSAIEALQHMFDGIRAVSGTRMAAAQEWLVRIPMEFIELISQRRPEALVILAYYGALLHQSRHFWVVGNAGRQLIESITTFLGEYWLPWLKWPNESLDMPSDSVLADK